MKPLWAAACICIALFADRLCADPNETTVTSPDGRTVVRVWMSESGAPYYSVNRDDTVVLLPSRLGIIREDADFSRNLVWENVSPVDVHKGSYRMVTGKRRICGFHAQTRRITFQGPDKETLEIEFYVSNDGFAFRYEFPTPSSKMRVIVRELSSFKLPEDSKAWLSPHRNAGTGWCDAQPSYEEYYHEGVPVGTEAPEIAGWSFPALFRTGESWLLITESGLDASYCGCRLSQSSPEGEYSVAFAQPKEGTCTHDPSIPCTSPICSVERVLLPPPPQIPPDLNREEEAAFIASLPYNPGVSTPASVTPWKTPWRVVILGSLANLVESTLVTDLAPAPVSQYEAWSPGVATWSWGLLQDESVNFDTQKAFIGFAARMGWKYCLIDADWDTRIQHMGIRQLVSYAESMGVDLFLWYNASGKWNKTTYTPKGVMNDPISRNTEMARISRLGVKGIKVDYWPGDGQSSIAYYHDLLNDAARHKLLVILSGGTIPRGWNRSFPNLVTQEAVRGFEHITYNQDNADRAPVHCAILPFSRNVVGPMDYAPVCLDEIPGIVRRSSNAFELALGVIFESPIQHLVDTPEGMDKQPYYVVDFLRRLPTVWDDIELIEGYPGKHVILARYSGKRILIAGINALDEEVPVKLDLHSLGITGGGMIITDGSDPRDFSLIRTPMFTKSLTLEMAPKGGFVAEF
ncbi:MAG: glycoside hydrolase family 97 catalytic domain-containing protein [Opitutales bacterium]|nr:glycoside hydrolase family 97 catalytic domain-containing protein [Opitutales bacterium]